MNLKKKTKEDRIKEKLARKALKPVVKKKPRMTDQKKKLRMIFNEFIRVRDSIMTTGSPEFCKCCTCGKIKPNADAKIHAGHFIKSTHNSTTFDSRNVHGQCSACNTFKGGCEAEYSGYIIKHYGLDVFNYLLAQKHVPRQYKAVELIELQQTYSKRLDDIIKEHPEYKRKSPKATKI